MASRWWNPGQTLGRQFILLIGAAIVATQVTDLCVRLAMPPTISGVSMGLVLTRIQTALPALDAASATAAQDVARSIGDRRFRVTLTPTPPPPVAPPSAPRARRIAILALGLPESAVRIVKFGPEHELHMPPPRNATPAGLGIRPNVPPNVEIDPARFDYVVLPGRPLALAIRTGHGWLVVQDAENGEAVWLAGIVPDLAITVLLLLPLGLWAGSRVGHKLRTFSAAIAEAGAAPNAPPLEEDGPTELRQVIRAVNQMRARILSLQADRDMMMAAMSHDVRTPLARLRFRIADLPPDVRRPIGEEIEEIDQLVDDLLSLSHTSQASMRRARFDLTAVAQTIVDELSDAGADVTFEGPERVTMLSDLSGVRRIITNLTQNALQYAGSAAVKIVHDNGSVVVAVEDHGPGIPADTAEAVFEPFRRLEPSRSRTSGGSGMGLAIARHLAVKNGGELVLDRAWQEGARFVLTLPDGLTEPAP